MKTTREYDRPIKVADGIYWVGFYEEQTNLHCNPYLITEGQQAVLIDGGSRPDFAVVMMKILQAGVDPKQIIALIYQHMDPDLCGSMSNMIDICENKGLKIISDTANNTFLTYYIKKENHDLLETLEDYRYRFTFNGRELQFFKTPYAHTAGSFVTYDTKTKTLFTSDLFGSFSKEWDLFVDFDDECIECKDYNVCEKRKSYCPLPDIMEFHRKIMPSGKALRYAMDVIKKIDIDILAPQHGSVITNRKAIQAIIEKFYSLGGVGIDSYL